MATNKIQILYEDDDVLVINKPAGLVVHADGRTKETTLVDWILENYPKIKGVGDIVTSEKLPVRRDLGAGGKVKSSELDRSGIVHRLDRETSGVLLIAKNQTAFVRLKKQFARREVSKMYHAFVYGLVKHDEGVIDRPIARSRRNPVLWSAMRGRRGEEREAVTEYRVVARCKGLTFATKVSPLQPPADFTFLELMPRTGRTHQIRVHLKAINYPVVCDKLYAPQRECMLGFSRLALHARSVSFLHPVSQETMVVEAPYPKDFERAIAKISLESRIRVW